MDLLIIHRTYPNPGGRKTFVTTLLESKKWTAEVVREGARRPGFIGLAIFSAVSFWRVLRSKARVVLGIGPSSIGGFVAARLLGKQCVLNLSDTNLRSLRLQKKPGVRGWFGKIITRVVEGMCLRLAQNITVPSQCASDYLIEDYPYTKNKILVISEGLYHVHPPSTDKPSSKTILLPWMSERKNASFLIPCLPDIISKTNARVVILGEKETLPRDQQRIIESLGEKVVFHGMSTLAELAPLGNCDLLLYVPRSEAHSYTILWALQHKLPYVSSGVGWLKETSVPELTLPTFERATLVAMTARFFERQKYFRDKLTPIAKRVLAKYRVTTMIKKYADLFGDLTR